MYDNLSKYEMNLRQGKVDISQGVGNALKCAIEFVRMYGNGKEPISDEALAELVVKWAEFFFQSSQRLIKEEYETWLVTEGQRLREQFNIQDIEDSKAEVKTIPVDTPPSNPFMKQNDYWKKVGDLSEKYNRPEIKKMVEERQPKTNGTEL